jgi:peptidoglycan/xylan/chitin deacetylase (PgdA/CDA1 family)
MHASLFALLLACQAANRTPAAAGAARAIDAAVRAAHTVAHATDATVRGTHAAVRGGDVSVRSSDAGLCAVDDGVFAGVCAADSGVTANVCAADNRVRSLEATVGPDVAAPIADAGVAAAPAAGQLPAFAIARVRTRAPVVALTFDACATLKQANGFDRAVFEILKREHIPVTIFPTGRWVETHPAEARELAAQDWVEFGNHSFSHARMTRLPRLQAIAQIARTEAIIAGLGRKSVAFRPPAGEWNPSVVRLAARQHLPTVEWDVISGDAGGRISAERSTAAVLSEARAGSIVIFHINGRGPHTKEALPDIIRGLREKGLGFVKVSALLQESDAQLVSARPTPFGHRPLHGGKRRPGKGGVDAHPPS